MFIFLFIVVGLCSEEVGLKSDYFNVSETYVRDTSESDYASTLRFETFVTYDSVFYIKTQLGCDINKENCHVLFYTDFEDLLTEKELALGDQSSFFTFCHFFGPVSRTSHFYIFSVQISKNVNKCHYYIVDSETKEIKTIDEFPVILNNYGISWNDRLLIHAENQFGNMTSLFAIDENLDITKIEEARNFKSVSFPLLRRGYVVTNLHKNDPFEYRFDKNDDCLYFASTEDATGKYTNLFKLNFSTETGPLLLQSTSLLMFDGSELPFYTEELDLPSVFDKEKEDLILVEDDRFVAFGSDSENIRVVQKSKYVLSSRINKPHVYPQENVFSRLHSESESETVLTNYHRLAIYMYRKENENEVLMSMYCGRTTPNNNTFESFDWCTENRIELGGDMILPCRACGGFFFQQLSDNLTSAGESELHTTDIFSFGERKFGGEFYLNRFSNYAYISESEYLLRDHLHGLTGRVLENLTAIPIAAFEDNLIFNLCFTNIDYVYECVPIVYISGRRSFYGILEDLTRKIYLREIVRIPERKESSEKATWLALVVDEDEASQVILLDWNSKDGCLPACVGRGTKSCTKRRCLCYNDDVNGHYKSPSEETMHFEDESVYACEECTEKYYGPSCLTECVGSDKCYGNGDCGDEGECICYDLFDEVGNCEFCSDPNRNEHHSCDRCKKGYVVEGREGQCLKLECGGLASDNSKVCGGHGVCDMMNNCSCDIGYQHDKFCTVWKCGEYAMNDHYVCSGNGQCLKPDLCLCHEGYVSPEDSKFCELIEKKKQSLWLLSLLVIGCLLPCCILSVLVMAIMSIMGTKKQKKKRRRSRSRNIKEKNGREGNYFGGQLVESFAELESTNDGETNSLYDDQDYTI